MPKPPITEQQALEWCYLETLRLTAAWIKKYESFQRIAGNDPDPTMRAAANAKARAFMQCAYETRHLESVLRLMASPDKPRGPKLRRALRLVVDNEKDPRE
ncbi:MAG: hypothetical protein IT529_06330 [Burkholderiales bacterium]|nr:hypothetical protein [Burkholderiales bacterium]